MVRDDFFHRATIHLPFSVNTLSFPGGSEIHVLRHRSLADSKSSDDWMESNSALPGGSLQSKPTWLNAFGYLITSFFYSWPRGAITKNPSVPNAVLPNKSLHRFVFVVLRS